MLHSYWDARHITSLYAIQGLLPTNYNQRWSALRPQTTPGNLQVREAAIYPAAVALTAILADMPRGPNWRTLPMPTIDVYLHRVATDVTDGYTPTGVYDPFRECPKFGSGALSVVAGRVVTWAGGPGGQDGGV